MVDAGLLAVSNGVDGLGAAECDLSGALHALHGKPWIDSGNAEAYLGVQLGEHSAKYLTDHARQLAALAVVLFVLLYLLIRFSDRWRKPAV